MKVPKDDYELLMKSGNSIYKDIVDNTRVYQEDPRLVPQIANRWQRMNVLAVVRTRDHRQSVC